MTIQNKSQRKQTSSHTAIAGPTGNGSKLYG